MQDIVFYVAAKETLGKVRDYSNMRNADAPLLTLGVAVCLRMRLFDDIEVSTPYPIASFNGITDWQWSMDDDFNRNTACTLVADAGGVSVHSVTDTVNGETMNFTEFVIQISNMNTEKLAAWLGSEGTKSGLTGELVGYDNGGHAVFVLQIEDFSVRNRVAGLGDPTVLDQEIVTRTQAEQMIQTAVSASASTKQDKLTSENAGTGISISSAGVISAENVPQSAVSGLESALSGKQNTLEQGFWIDIDDDWISVERYHTIHGPYSSGSVTLQAGEAYKIYATNSAVTLNSENIPNNTWGIEGHIEIFVANTGYIHTGSNVVLVDALEPDAVNNCTVRFHDGYAIISVEDHVAGYIVTVNAGTSSGSLYYGLATASNEYISIDASLNGQTLDLGGVTTSAGEKHVVGNGYSETVISGGVSCTSKTTFSNLSMIDASCLAGTMTLGDVYIPNGATVSVNEGNVYIEKVTGNGGVIDLGGTQTGPAYHTTATIESCVVTNGSGTYGGLVTNGGTINIVGGTYSGNLKPINIYANNPGTLYMESSYVTSNGSGGGISFGSNGNIILSSSVIKNNTNQWNNDIACWDATVSSFILKDCDTGKVLCHGSADIVGSNHIKQWTGSGSVMVHDGAIVDFTGEAGSSGVIINVSSGVTFAPGRATVYPSAGQTSSYVLGGIRVPKLGNTNVLDLGGTQIGAAYHTTATIESCVITSGYGTYGALVTNGGTLSITGCTVTGCTTQFAINIYQNNPGGLALSSSYVGGNNAGGVVFGSGATVEIVGSTINNNTGIALYVNQGVSSAVISNSIIGNAVVNGAVDVAGSNVFGSVSGSGSFTISSGAIIDLTGNSNATPIALSGGIIIPAGASVQISYSGDDNNFENFGITGSAITNMGRITGATISVPDGATCNYAYYSGETLEIASATGPATVVVDGELSYCG